MCTVKKTKTKNRKQCIKVHNERRVLLTGQSPGSLAPPPHLCLPLRPSDPFLVQRAEILHGYTST